MMVKYKLYNEDCIEGCKKYINDDSVDLIVTDPPYGIDGDTLHKHYNRDEDYVIDGYVEIPKKEYGEFSHKWIKQAERILKPGGSIYVVSGYTNLFHILDAFRDTSLKEMNHIIWKYNFGVYTKKKYVSSHYHILYWIKPRKKHTFNTYSRCGPREKDENGGSLNYQDREDVWIINREYKPGKTKNKNELPTNLLKKIIRYSSNENDFVCDLFLGGFSTAIVSIGMNRNAIGFEISENIYEHGMKKMKDVKPGGLLSTLKKPKGSIPFNQGNSWSEGELMHVNERYVEIYRKVGTKGKAIEILCEEFGRGRFSIMKAIKNKNEEEINPNQSYSKIEDYF